MCTDELEHKTHKFFESVESGFFERLGIPSSPSRIKNLDPWMALRSATSFSQFCVFNT